MEIPLRGMEYPVSFSCGGRYSLRNVDSTSRRNNKQHLTSIPEGNLNNIVPSWKTRKNL